MSARLLLLLGATLAALVLAVPAAAQDPLVEEGRDLYVAGCVSCHGPDARGVAPPGPRRGAGGVDGAGPSLHGVGAASAHLYLTTGYMPLDHPEEQPRRSGTRYTQEEIDALIAYIGSLGGPPIPEVAPERGDLSEGLQLYTEYCAGCHQMAGEGGVVVGGVAPPLEAASAVQIAEAVRVGPYVMPAFGEDVIDDRELDSLVRFVLELDHLEDPGGWALGRVGPINEGLVAWLLAGVALVSVAVVIGARAR